MNYKTDAIMTMKTTLAMGGRKSGRRASGYNIIFAIIKRSVVSQP